MLPNGDVLPSIKLFLSMLPTAMAIMRLDILQRSSARSIRGMRAFSGRKQYASYSQLQRRSIAATCYARQELCKVVCLLFTTPTPLDRGYVLRTSGVV